MNKTNEGSALADQVAIVTGGGRGIGRAITLALAKAGAAVAVVARSKDQLAETVALVEQAGGRAIAVPADVTDQQAVEQAAAKTQDHLGPIDLLVNNAGVGGPICPTWMADPDKWWRCIEVNLRGPFLCSRAVLPGMVARGRGRIVNTASSAALRPLPYLSAYGISKTALARLTESLAAETEEHGICVFSIHPGFVRTAMTEGTAELPGDEVWLGGNFRKHLAAGRGGHPERAANLVVLLASGRADALSGRYISVRDDVDEMVGRAKEIREKGLYTLRLHS
jgi:NAD(P)-dependent dehydrogenase (short-subunit alcohol dehydrogenase family)